MRRTTLFFIVLAGVSFLVPHISSAQSSEQCAAPALFEVSSDKRRGTPGSTLSWSVILGDENGRAIDAPISVTISNYTVGTPPLPGATPEELAQAPQLTITRESVGTVIGTVTLPKAYGSTVTITAGTLACGTTSNKSLTIGTNNLNTITDPTPCETLTNTISEITTRDIWNELLRTLRGSDTDRFGLIGGGSNPCISSVLRALGPLAAAGLGALLLASNILPHLAEIISALGAAIGEVGNIIANGTLGHGFTQLANLFTGGFFGKRRQKRWVRVVDPITGKGIGGALVHVRTPDGKIRATWTTDRRTGITGDFLPPGTYEFIVEKDGVQFPSVEEPLFRPRIGETIYRSGPFQVSPPPPPRS